MSNDNKPAAAQEAVAWLSKDDAQLALFQAIQGVKLGNQTDDKLILANLREAGLWIGRYEAAPVAAAPVVTDPVAAYERELAAGATHEHALHAICTPAAPVDCCPHCGGTAGHWEGCRSPVDSPSTTAPGIDPADPWRGLYAPELMPKLDGVDAYHVAHPDLPSWPKGEDEERGVSPLVKAQGFELEAVFGEYPDDDDEDPDYCAWLAQWQPAPPVGEHWRLVCIQDTEDGPAAFYVRPFALIDASPKGEQSGNSGELGSPKGGSDALASAASRIVNGARKKAGGGWWMVSPSEMDELRDALQATSAEVGA